MDSYAENIPSEHLTDLTVLLKYLNTDIENGLDENVAKRLFKLVGKNKYSLPSGIAISDFEYSWNKLVRRKITAPKWTQYQWDILFNSRIGNIYKVVRSSKKCYISGWSLVRGDLVLLQRGDIVPADIRVISCEGSLVVNNLVITKSHADNKSHRSTSNDFLKTENMLFANTQIIQGSCKGLVLQTGDRTVFGNLVKYAQKISYTPYIYHETSCSGNQSELGNHNCFIEL